MREPRLARQASYYRYGSIKSSSRARTGNRKSVPGLISAPHCTGLAVSMNGVATVNGAPWRGAVNEWTDAKVHARTSSRRRAMSPPLCSPRRRGPRPAPIPLSSRAPSLITGAARSILSGWSYWGPPPRPAPPAAQAGRRRASNQTAVNQMSPAGGAGRVGAWRGGPPVGP